MPEGVRTQRGQPATKEDLIGVIKKGKQQGKLVSIYTEQIEKNGVDFLLIPPDERKIREVGSYLDGKVLDQLINAVRDNYRARTFLSGHIEQVEVTENSGGGAQVFIRLSVKNAGQATIAHQYSLRIMHATRRSIDFKDRPVELNESFPLRKEGAKDLVIHPQDALALKPNRSIGKGRTESGWLRFIVPELPEFTPDFLRQEGMWYVVSFTDAAGLSYEAHYVW